MSTGMGADVGANAVEVVGARFMVLVPRTDIRS